MKIIYMHCGEETNQSDEHIGPNILTSSQLAC